MVHFWLATFDLDTTDALSYFGPAGAATRHVAIEVLRDDATGRSAVLISTVMDPDTLQLEMTCLLGFTDDANGCRAWNDRGFPLIDAAFQFEEQPGSMALRVMVPSFPAGERHMRYDTTLMTITAPPSSGASDGPLSAFEGRYIQEVQAPDAAQPDTLMARRRVTWHPVRRHVRDQNAAIDIAIGPPQARIPGLAPLETMTRRAIWTGHLAGRARRATKHEHALRPVPFAHVLGAPAFRFENVETFGFRIDLTRHATPDWRRRLGELIQPLNFHLLESVPDSGAPFDLIPDFRYRAATHTLVVELLRYGRMRARAPAPPLDADDSQSQHELLIRLLVGRVDDDSAQGRAPAMYVPAIFVDNPWSTAIGRNVIGYDKYMAEFCVMRDGVPMPLRPDGRLPAIAGSQTGHAATDDTLLPLGEVSEVRLLTGTGERPRLLALDLSPRVDTAPDAMTSIDFDFTFGRLGGARWRQSDFDDAEFRRSFAGEAVADSVRVFRGVQVAPVRHRLLDRTWVMSRFNIDSGIKAELPRGRATLVLHEIDGRSHAGPSCRMSPYSTRGAWNLLCRMLGSTDNGGTATVTLHRGDWYRLYCSMDLTIDDGLDWLDGD